MTLALQPWPEDTTAASWGSIGSTEQMREDTSHAPRADARGIVINDGGIFFFFKTDKQERSFGFKNQPISLL